MQHTISVYKTAYVAIREMNILFDIYYHTWGGWIIMRSLCCCTDFLMNRRIDTRGWLPNQFYEIYRRLGTIVNTYMYDCGAAASTSITNCNYFVAAVHNTASSSSSSSSPLLSSSLTLDSTPAGVVCFFWLSLWSSSALVEQLCTNLLMSSIHSPWRPAFVILVSSTKNQLFDLSTIAYFTLLHICRNSTLSCV